MKILVVDDNPINLMFLFYSLRDKYDIEMADNGNEALNLTRRMKYDLIIMDLWMPVIDGAETTRQIRLLDNNMNNKTPIIFCTASCTENDKKRCIASGANDYLIKPVRVDSLKEKLRYYLG